MNRMDTIAAWIQPDEVPGAMKLLRELEKSGHVDADEAAAWRCRIVGWATFYEIDARTCPSD